MLDRFTDRTRLARAIEALLCSLISLCHSPAYSVDRVTVRGESGAGKVVLLGDVLEWTGGLLRIRTGNDVREIHAGRVVDVETSRLRAHIEGLDAFEAGKPGDAVMRLSSALEQEPRVWMRREILAALVRADLALGRRGEAARHFLAIVSSDPATRHFSSIPLDWTTEAPDAALAGAARTWLRTPKGDVSRLLGASLLLFDPSEGDAAAKALDDLASTTDRQIFTLARAQLWRLSLARGDVPVGEILRWEDRVREIPEPLRGGAYYLIGRAWADAGQPEQAAGALLWLPLVYDSNPALAAEAAVLAGDELAKIGRTADAVVLFREVAARFRATGPAATAASRLENLSAATPREVSPAPEQ